MKKLREQNCSLTSFTTIKGVYGMTGDLRKELEKQYEIAAAAAARKKQSPKSEPTEPNGGIIDNQYQDAPRSYKKEYAEMFKQLPPAMRKYLHERESEIERGFSRLNNELNNHRWIDEAYSSRSERLCKNGICKAQDWIEAMALVDDALDKNPTDALQKLSGIYGVSSLGGDDIKAGVEQILSSLSALDDKLSQFVTIISARLQDAEHLAESKKAKEASFAPKGKNSQRDLSKLSTREILELKLAEYED